MCVCVFLWIVCVQCSVLYSAQSVLAPETRSHWPAFHLYLKRPENTNTRRHTQIHNQFKLRPERD